MTQTGKDLQRFNVEHPCPICGGYDALERGVTRCGGYLEGDIAFCTRVLGNLPRTRNGGAPHELDGTCSCGELHTSEGGVVGPNKNGSNGHKKQTSLSFDDPKATAHFEYKDALGNILYWVVRYELPNPESPKGHDKTFRQFRNVHGKPVLGIKKGSQYLVKLVLYRLPELLASPSKPVLILEGEKAVDVARSLGFVATCNSMGAGKWNITGADYSQALRGRTVFLLPDNDQAGKEHMQDVAKSLAGVAKSVKTVTLPKLPPGGDLVDWVAAGGTREKLDAICNPRIKFTYASDVQVKEYKWSWEGMVAIGECTLFVGDAGLGKGLTISDIIAHVTKGEPLPGDTFLDAGGVVLMSPEDSEEHTLVPRLMAAGAVLKKVLLLNRIETYDAELERYYKRPLSFPEDVPVLIEAIEHAKGSLVVIDPILSMLSDRIDAHRNHAVRRALGQVLDAARENNCALIGVMHTTKSMHPNVLFRSSSSSAFIELARAALFFVPDPDGEPGQSGVIVNYKNNLRPKGPSYRYSIHQNPQRIGYIQWEGESTRSREELLDQIKPETPKTSLETGIIKVLKSHTEAMNVAQIHAELDIDAENNTIAKVLQRGTSHGVFICPIRGYYTYAGNPLYTPTDKKKRDGVQSVQSVPFEESVQSVGDEETTNEEKVTEALLSDLDSVQSLSNLSEPSTGGFNPGLDSLDNSTHVNNTAENVTELGSSGFIPTSSPLEDALVDAITQFADYKELVVDLETTGLHPDQDKVIVILLGSNASDFFYIDMRPYYEMCTEDQENVKSMLQELLMREGVTWVGHNLKFDMRFLLHHFGVRLANVFDTRIAEKLIHNDGAKGKLKLVDLAKRYKLECSKEERNWFIGLDTRLEWGISFPEAQIGYMRQDIVVPHLIQQKQREQEMPLYDFEQEVIHAVVAMEDHGVLIDVGLLKQQLNRKAQEARGALQKLRQILEAPNLNPNSPQQVLPLLKGIGVDVQNTQKETLEKARQAHPAVEALLEYKGLKSFIDEKWLTKVGVDGRIHASYDQAGPVTWRFSCSEPNMQNIPKSQEIRSAFIAPVGSKMLAADFSNIELRELAEYSGDQRMLQLFADNADLHAETARLMFGLAADVDTKKHLVVGKPARDLAKKINYALSYGTGALGLASQLDISVDESKQLLKAHSKAYPTAAKYLAQIGLQGIDAWETGASITTPAGRSRSFQKSSEEWHVRNQAKNFPMQADCASIIKRAMVLLHQNLPEGAHLVMSIHDEVVIEAKDAVVEEAKRVIETCLVAACRQFLKAVAIPVPEVQVAQYWMKG